MKNKIKKIVIVIIAVVILATIGRFLFREPEKPITNSVEIQEIEQEKEPSPLVIEYQKNKEKNEDYVAKLSFKSGLIDKPVVQAKSIYNKDGSLKRFFTESGKLVTEDVISTACGGDCTGNDVYIWTDWETGNYDRIDNGGSIFMDYRNELSDQNLIIYGHHFSEEYKYDKERSKAFTPLEKLTEQENYKDNKYIDLILNGEIRTYEVAVIFEYSLLVDDSEMQYYRTNYNTTYTGEDDPDYAEKYFAKIKELAYYDTGVELKPEDKTLTLQTCYSLRPNYREILVAKEISRQPIE